jgi:hypothetical protein
MRLAPMSSLHMTTMPRRLGVAGVAHLTDRVRTLGQIVPEDEIAFRICRLPAYHSFSYLF